MGKLNIALVREALERSRAEHHDEDLHATEIEDLPHSVVETAAETSSTGKAEELFSKLLTEIRKLTKSIDRNSCNLDSRWLNSTKAAQWCGDMSKERFLKLAKKYRIPRHGHAKKLFDRFELDEWIRDPRCFLNTNSPSLRRGRKGTAMEAINTLCWYIVNNDGSAKKGNVW